jgi:hypothetical protein
LRQCRGVASVRVDLSPGRAVVTGERLDTEQLLATVATMGYSAEVL